MVSKKANFITSQSNNRNDLESKGTPEMNISNARIYLLLNM